MFYRIYTLRYIFMYISNIQSHCDVTISLGDDGLHNKIFDSIHHLANKRELPYTL